VATAAFLVAMAMLGVAGAVVVVRQHPSAGASPAAGPSPPPHHLLRTPYGSGGFLRGQPAAQTKAALGRSFAKDYSHQYVTTGYAWLAITDANTPTPATLFQIPGLAALPAEEADYAFADFYAFDVGTHHDAATPQEVVNWIHDNAGVAYLARPLAAPALDPSQIEAIRGLDGIQIYDARLVRDQPAQADAGQLWDQLLTAGDHVWGLVADDSQDTFGPSSTVGQTSVDAQVASPDPVLIADALRRGAFVDSAGVHILEVAATGDTITVTTADADQVTFVGSGGRTLATVAGARAAYRVHWDEGYVRAVATRAGGGRAWSQPVWVVP
jgi:hypothetical protein